MKRKKIRKNYIIHITMFALAAALVMSVLSVTVLFNTHNIVVSGESVYTDEEIITASKITEGVNLVRFNRAKAERNIMDNLVLLDSVSVKKKFPSTLSVTVKGAERKLSVLSDGLYYSVSEKRRIIEIDKAPPGDGLTVIGCEPSEREAGAYLRCDEDEEKVELVFTLADLLKKHEFYFVTVIDVTDRLDIVMYCEKRLEIKMGAPVELDGKISVAKEIIENHIDSNEKGVLRISNPQKPTFKPQLSEKPHIPEHIPEASSSGTQKPSTQPPEPPDEPQPSEPPDEPQPSETPDESQPSEPPDEPQPSETPDEPQPSETPDEPQPSEPPDEPPDDIPDIIIF
ncbi:MAG: FtsQ-type POTRA domain-containing protein [Oscillospiraceae bacterium]|nr:FtsQ-type POTRA domain-containing protein [Oscillospiraceae bacterium]